jgi:hydrogenase expression/formation protein HypD
VRYADGYRDPRIVKDLLGQLADRLTRPWTVMEVCGGQTHTLLREGIDQLIPEQLELVHGPGCPVCVTPTDVIDQAHALANRTEVIMCSFGDMLRVPGSSGDLLHARAAGADVRIVYSPLDAVELAAAQPDRFVVFFAVGFETTAPTTAMAVQHADRLGLDNFAVLVAHVLVPPAMTAVLSSTHNRVQGFLAPGHVDTVMGWTRYEPIAHRFGVPIVVTGFEPVDLVQGLVMLVTQLEGGTALVENQYTRSATRTGNAAAQKVLGEVFEPCDRAWRGIGVLPASGLRLRARYAHFDALERFPGLPQVGAAESDRCIAGLVLQGRARPSQCPSFGTDCTPEHPLGAPMVSSEGACAAYHLAGKHQEPAP